MTALQHTEWQDQWIAENYPHAAFWIDKSGEVIVTLGVDEDGNDCS